MADASGGYVLIYRRLLDNPAFRTPAEAMAFAYLVLLASWKPSRVRYKDRSITLQRGQVAVSVRDFAAAMGRSKSWADRFLKRLAERDIIETVDGTGVNVITICNYSEYQTNDYQGGTVVELKPGQDRDTEQRKEYRKEDYSLPLEKERKVISRKTAWPSDATPPDRWLLWAMSNKGWTKSQALSEADKFIDHALANRRLCADWFAAWRGWCRSQYQSTVSREREPLTL